MKKRTVMAVVAAAAALAIGQSGMTYAVPPPSVVWIEGGATLRFLAQVGTTNTVTVQVDPGDPALYLVTDTTHIVAARFPCVGISSNSANCPVAGPTSLTVQLGDLNDSVVNRTTLPGFLGGDAGSDRLFGGTAAETLDGGADGDFLDGGRGGDFMNGSAGIDWAMYNTRANPVTVTLNNAAGDGEAGENDNAFQIENAQGGTGNDTLIGNAASNNLIGGPGVDHHFGEAGNDVLQGGLGAGDVMSGGDGADFMDGGPDAGDTGDGDWNQDNVNDDGDADNCSAATEIQWSC